MSDTHIFAKVRKTNMAALIESAGGLLIGVLEGYVYFNDPETGSTLCLEYDRLIHCGIPWCMVRDKIMNSREEFRRANR